MIKNFTIDENACKNCSLCIQECGHHEDKQHLKRVEPDNPDCSRCYHCYTVCPSNAIHISEDSGTPVFNPAVTRDHK